MKQWIGFAALALAACNGGGDGGENAGGGNAAAAGNSAKGGAAAAQPAGGGSPAAMQAGEWEITTQVTGVDAPNVSAAPQGAIPPQTRRACLTQAELSQPGGIAAGGVTNASGCRAEGNSENGRIRSTIRCEGPGGGRVDVTTSGTSTATSLDLNVETRVAAPGATMNTRARITGRRLGDCPG